MNNGQNYLSLTFEVIAKLNRKAYTVENCEYKMYTYLYWHLQGDIQHIVLANPKKQALSRQETPNSVVGGSGTRTQHQESTHMRAHI